MKALRIIIPGLLTTVQDGGRTGNAALGFSQCGAIDEDSMREANILVGNDDFDAVLELTLTGISAVALCNLYVAVTGGAREVYVNGEKVNTSYLSASMLSIDRADVEDGDTITVCQVGSSDTIFRTSENEVTFHSEGAGSTESESSAE